MQVAWEAKHYSQYSVQNRWCFMLCSVDMRNLISSRLNKHWSANKRAPPFKLFQNLFLKLDNRYISCYVLWELIHILKKVESQKMTFWIQNIVTFLLKEALCKHKLFHFISLPTSVIGEHVHKTPLIVTWMLAAWVGCIANMLLDGKGKLNPWELIPTSHFLSKVYYF